MPTVSKGEEDLKGKGKKKLAHFIREYCLLPWKGRGKARA